MLEMGVRFRGPGKAKEGKGVRVLAVQGRENESTVLYSKALSSLPNLMSSASLDSAELGLKV